MYKILKSYMIKDTRDREPSSGRIVGAGGMGKGRPPGKCGRICVGPGMAQSWWGEGKEGVSGLKKEHEKTDAI